MWVTFDAASLQCIVLFFILVFWPVFCQDTSAWNGSSDEDPQKSTPEKWSSQRTSSNQVVDVSIVTVFFCRSHTILGRTWWNFGNIRVLQVASELNTSTGTTKGASWTHQKRACQSLCDCAIFVSSIYLSRLTMIFIQFLWLSLVGPSRWHGFCVL